VGATAIDFKQTVELAASTGISVAVAEVGDKMVFTITNTLPGGGVTSFPGFDANAGSFAADGTASAGNTGLASHSNHAHPLSSQYKTRTLLDSVNPLGAAFSVNPGFTPRVAIFVTHQAAVGIAVGVAIGAGAADQAYVRMSGNAGNTSVFEAGFVNGDGAEKWACDAFTSSNVNITRSGGAGTAPGCFVTVIGDNLPA
jgi:hypothetical protein